MSDFYDEKTKASWEPYGDGVLHELWTIAVGCYGYDKAKWKELERLVHAGIESGKGNTATEAAGVRRGKMVDCNKCTAPKRSANLRTFCARIGAYIRRDLVEKGDCPEFEEMDKANASQMLVDGWYCVLRRGAVCIMLVQKRGKYACNRHGERVHDWSECTPIASLGDVKFFDDKDED